MLSFLGQEGFLDKEDLVRVRPNGMDFRAKLDNGMTDAVNPMKCRVLP